MEKLLTHESDVIKSLQDSLGDPEFCDVRIVGTDGEIGANKTILGIRSLYFRSMFSANNNFVESQVGSVKLPYAKAVLEKVVIYLYSGKMTCEGLVLGSLLELLDLLNLTNLLNVFGAVEEFTVSQIKIGHFPLSDCLRSLGDCSRLGLENVGDSLLTHLGRYFWQFSEDEAVGTLSGDMIARLLEEEREVEDVTIDRFTTLVTWLSFNVETSIKKELLELINFDHFTVEELASDVRKSGLYDKDCIIEKMEQLYCETRTEMKKLFCETRAQEEKIREYKTDIGTIKGATSRVIYSSGIKINPWAKYVPCSIQNKY